MAGLGSKALYVTADAIGTATGGGKVTHHESRALASLGDVDDMKIWQFPDEDRPWGADRMASARLELEPSYKPERAHFYSGTFTKTIEILKARGTSVSYTAAAHSIEISKAEHERLGLPFDYPHLTEPHQWVRYLRGYLLADVVVCPSKNSAALMQNYGCKNVVVIPHGFDPPAKIAPVPDRFVVGYLGQPGPDKGLAYLIDAWSRWSAGRSNTDALLMIAGRGTLGVASWIRDLFGPSGSYYVRGEVADPSELYDACCVYVQPSASEGFGCEVLEARAHGRPVICSDGAGACDFANQVVSARDAGAIARAIDRWHARWKEKPQSMITWADPSGISSLTWKHVRWRYAEFWTMRELAKLKEEVPWE